MRNLIKKRSKFGSLSKLKTQKKKMTSQESPNIRKEKKKWVNSNPNEKPHQKRTKR